MAESKNPYEAMGFEKPIIELERRITELENFSRKAGVDLSAEINRLKQRNNEQKKEIYANLTPWQRVLLARDPQRPETTDYLSLIFENVLELHGDKAFRDDPAILTALCRIGQEDIMLIAHCRGKTTKERMQCNFGSPHPEGYRKALEKMKLAERFHLPVITLVNTPGAYPGIGAEERGQATIIARNLLEMSRLKTPIISVVIGEGGSGGALGICVADKLSIMENAYLSVISPEGCAAILWRDSAKAPLAAEMLRLTPKDLMRLGIVDEIIPEPLGGAHRDHAETGRILKDTLLRYLSELKDLSLDELLERRYQKYRKIGVFIESTMSRIASPSK